MREAGLMSPNNSGNVMRLEIKQKSTHTKKRKVKTWSPEEDDQLVKLYDEYPKKWGIIASLMQDRNENQCLHRYRRLSQLGAHKKIWSAEEDQTILSLIKKVGKNWKLLAEVMGTKTGKQIRERFINKLDPRIKTEEWTDEEDKLILKYYSEVGSRWSEISKKLIGRPENKIKNRFYSYIQKNYDIRYVYVNAKSIENEQEKPESSEVQYQNSEEDLNQPNLEEPQKENDENHLREICQNHKKPENVKHSDRLKYRIKERVPRFQANKQENIFEEENDQENCQAQVGHIQHRKPMRESLIQEEIILPSIKDLEDEFKISPEIQMLQGRLEISGLYEKEEGFDSNVLLGQKYQIKSLIRMEDEIGPMENKLRSIRDIVSNNEIENNENELFYLSH